MMPFVLLNAAARKRHCLVLSLLAAALPLSALAADVVAANAAVAGAVPAQPEIQADGSVRHIVQLHETLYGLAQFYLEDPMEWPALKKANAIPNPRRLKPGSIVAIPAELLGNAGGATVLHVSGTVTLTRAGAEPQPLAEGMRVLDRDIVRTEHNGFATLQLIDGSILRAAGDSELVADRLKYMVRKKRSETVIDLERGRVESSVAPQSPTGSRFSIRTPLMAAGVRGTQFGVSITDDGKVTSDVLEGHVAISGLDAADTARDSVPAALVGAGQGVLVTQLGATAQLTMLLPAPDLAAIPDLHQRPVIDFVFPPVAGARAYRAYLSDDQALDFTRANAIVTSPRVRFDGMADGNYFVVVRAIDDNGVEGQPSVHAIRLKARPEPPVTLEPSQDQELDSGSLALRWSTRKDLAGYDLQVASDEQFGHLVADRQGVEQGTYEVSGLASGSYYWRLRAFRKDASGAIDHGPYGDARRFVVRRPLAVAAPERQGDVTLFRWDGEAGQHYLVQIARDENFATVVQSINTDERQASAGSLPGGDYYLRIRATDADGFVRSFTPPQQFRVENVVRSDNGQSLQSSDGGLIERH